MNPEFNFLNFVIFNFYFPNLFFFFPNFFCFKIVFLFFFEVTMEDQVLFLNCHLAVVQRREVIFYFCCS